MSILRSSHLTLERHEDIVKCLGARIPVLKTRERRHNTAVGLVDVTHVDLRGESDLRRNLRILRTTVDLQEVKTTVMTSLFIFQKKKVKNTQKML